MIQSGVLYTRQEVIKLGIGDRELLKARQSGAVPMRLIGKRGWFLGDDIIRWSEVKKETPPRGGADGSSPGS